jgi:hypothetical protein
VCFRKIKKQGGKWKNKNKKNTHHVAASRKSTVPTARAAWLVQCPQGVYDVSHHYLVRLVEAHA